MRNIIIDNLRGLCMLGVVAIHIGTLGLQANDFTLNLFLELLTRYSIPAFFFVSGYGLACTDKGLLNTEQDSFTYLSFLKKRLRGAGLPYLTWSLFYLFYFWLVLPPGYVSWHPKNLFYVLFYGFGCYQLYFMVILIWFYIFYPLWRKLFRCIHKIGLFLGMTLLLIFQLTMNWYTTHPTLNITDWPMWAQNFFNNRLNFWPLHYIFVFMLGMVFAVYWQEIKQQLKHKLLPILLFYLATVGYHVGSCYYAFTYEGYDLLALDNTYHQLSPQGLFYTIGTVLFFSALLIQLEESSCTKLKGFIKLLADYSMLVYFLHPLFLEWMMSAYTQLGIVMTVKRVTASYILLILVALLASWLIQKLIAKNSLLKLLCTGKG